MFITLWILFGIFVGLPVTLLSMVCPPLAGIVTFCWVVWVILLIAAIGNSLDSISNSKGKLTPEEEDLNNKYRELGDAYRNLCKARKEALNLYIQTLTEVEIENSIYANLCEIKDHIKEATGVVLSGKSYFECWDYVELWKNHPRVVQVRARIEKDKRIKALEEINKKISVLNKKIGKGELI